MRGSRKIASIVLAFVATIMFSATSQADGTTQIYKWVDKNGETHFSQLPPKHGKSQIFNPDYATPGPGETDAKAPAEQAKDEAKKPLQANQPVLAINKKEAAKACKQAKAQIKMLQDGQNQLMTQDADGKYRPLTAKEIASRLKQAQDVANKACVK